jgi:hypothetical protein
MFEKLYIIKLTDKDNYISEHRGHGSMEVMLREY